MYIPKAVVYVIISGNIPMSCSLFMKYSKKFQDYATGIGKSYMVYGGVSKA